MAKTYYLAFGTNGDPTQYFGLAPTFLTFSNNGSAVTPPAIGSVAGATGFYSFAWGTTTPIVFLADAATTSPGAAGRYVFGALDPSDRADEYGTTMVALGATIITQLTNTGATLVGIGNTSTALGISGVAIGTTLTGFANTLLALGQSSTLFSFIGSTASSFGSTSIDPTTVFGFLMRAQELAEGNNVYAKATGVLDMYSRGSSTLLREKTISDSSSQTTKT